jgi:PIN domain nuclease of toxin-antitoxin system
VTFLIGKQHATGTKKIMRCLLDTHLRLWSFRELRKLSSQVHQALGDRRNSLFLSPVSVWEVMVLQEKKKLEMHEDFMHWFARSVNDLQIGEAILNWKVVHEMRYILPNHKNPADRFLAATAIARELVLGTADQKLTGVPRLEVLVKLRA